MPLRRIRWTWRMAAAWCAAIIIPFGLENYAELSQFLSNSCEQESTGPLAHLSAWYYQAIEWLTPFDSTPSHVKVVTIDSSSEGGWVSNPCESRIFTARLLHSIAIGQPAAVLIDWSNAPDSCFEDATNGAYKMAVENTALRFPVIFARSTMNMDTLERTNMARYEQLPSGERGGDHFWEEPDLFDTARAQGIGFGLSRLNCDVRKIPLRWWVFDETSRAKPLHSRLVNTLAVEGITRANYQDVLNGSRIKKLLAANQHPFSQFTKAFEVLHAIDVVCDDRPPQFTPKSNCAAVSKTAERLTHLRGKIVLIADTTSENDYHSTPVGIISGALLHANYIEALISGRYWKPANLILQLMVSLCWFAVVEIVFALHEQRPLVALGLSLGVTAAFGFVLYYLLVMLLGYYFVLLPPSLILIAIRTVQLVTHRHRHHSTAAVASQREL